MGDFYATEPKRLRDEFVGTRVVHCPNCREQRWYGYGPCMTCRSFLPDEVAHSQD